MMRGRWLAMIAVMSAAASPGLSATQASTPLAQPITWNLNWDPPYCQISTGDPKDLAFSIWSVPGSGTVELYFIGAKGRVPEMAEGAKVSVQLAPNATTTDGTAVWMAPFWNGVLVASI